MSEPVQGSGPPTGSWRREGFAVVVTVFAIVIIGAVIAGGYFVAYQQFRIGSAGPAASSAFYAAEAGLGAALSGWDVEVLDLLGPGESVGLAAGELETGERYEVVLTRTDTAQFWDVDFYVIVSTGMTRGPWGGRRQVATLLRRQRPDSLCCDSALRSQGGVTVSGEARVDGNDHPPEPWLAVRSACADLTSTSGPGVTLADTGSVGLLDGGIIAGDPPVWRPGDAQGDLLPPAERWFDEAAALADVALAGGSRLGEIGPAVGDDGECAGSLPTNWGAPESPGHACFDYMPVIHVAGDLSIEGGGGGQGILLVEGDLEVGGDFKFYGVVVTGGRLRVGDRVRLTGGVSVYGGSGGVSEVGGWAVIERSECAVRAALRGSKLYLPHPLADLAWVEILD
ncbi:MAG: hypothetical protein JSU87_13135 [Gemmatimonadota bacterium]|nr:MAG: hypothetical protein JSU87_13135 [Gemmatimonadota bacterium]